MPIFLPCDLAIVVPFSGLLDKWLLDFDIVDIVVWFPRLSWVEFAKAFGAYLACKCMSDQIDRWAFAPIKHRIKARLARQVVLKWPSLARRLNLAAAA
ncbi:MAG: hypothetical protein ABL874_07090 [Sphingopyxis sp.]